jgi:glutamine synthetase
VTTIDAELLTVTFVDNGGITRAKTVPALHADRAASAGIGASTTFSVFTGLDAIGSAHGLEVPTGDFRLVADLAAAAIDGPWAWAPADLCDTEGAPWPTCSRTFARAMEQRLADRGLRLQASFETEFTVWDGEGSPLHEQPAYGLEATRAAGAFLLALVRRLQALGIEVDQVHPEYSPDLLGNGAHLHLSLWRGDDNLVGSGDDAHGMAPDARAFLAGLLAELPALVGVGCGSPVSYLRLGPSRWTGVFSCWGLENREAPLRLIRGSRSTRPHGANIELKPVDASGNPYLAIGAAIAAGLGGIEAGLELGPECTIDPATMTDAARAAAGLAPLPADLEAATDALRSSSLLLEAMGEMLHGSLVGVRVREHDDAMGLSAEGLCERYRFRY